MKYLNNLGWLGAISYSIYIIQEPIYTFLFSVTPLHWGQYLWMLVCFLVMALIFFLSIFLENIYQPWIGSQLKKMLLSRN